MYREPKPLHTTPIFIHHALAILLRIIAIGEQHAFVAGGFLILADTAGLFHFVSLIAAWLLNGVGASGVDKVGGVGSTLTFADASPGGLRSEARLAAVEGAGDLCLVSTLSRDEGEEEILELVEARGDCDILVAWYGC